MQNSLAKKLFAVGVASATALMSFAPLAAHAAAHAAGTNVKSSDGTIWMITLDGQRRAYTSAGAFLSYGFNSFASVVDANSDDLALPAGSFIPPQDGSIICSDRGADKGTCYFVSSGMKYGFTSAAVFTGLGFSFSNAKSGDVSWMASGASLINSSSMQHLTGALINKSGTVYLVGANGLLGIPDIATFNSWGYSFANVVPANTADGSLTQTGVMVMRTAGQLSPSWTGNPNTPPVVSGSVSASLASDTPASQTIAINGASGASSGSSTVATLAKFAFSGSGTVTQVQIKRVGVSADTIINNAYLYNGNTRLTDAASVGGNSTITFNNPAGLFTVNGVATISLVVEVAGGTTSGQTLGAQLVSFTVANGAAASVAISGNLFTTSSVTDLATAQFVSVTPTGGSYDAAPDVMVFRSLVTINTRDMKMSRLIIRNIGTSQQADINNFRLFVDGAQIAQSQTMDANGYVNFSFSPSTLKAGSREVKVLADVVSGSSRNFQFQVRNKADVDFMDTQYNTSVAPVNTFPVGSASSNSINSGTMTIVKATDSPSGNVTDGASSVVLGKYTITAYGEAQKIETIKAGFSSSDASVGSLRNGRIMVNGVQYGSTATLASSTPGGTSFTLNYTVQPGVPVTLEVLADLYDNDANGNQLSNSDTVTVSILTGSSNVQKLTSLAYSNVPTTSVAASAITDVTGSVTLSKNNNYTTQTIPQPQTGYLLGSFNLVGSTSEDANITSFNINLGASSTSLANLNNVSLKINGAMFGTVKGTVSTTSASSTYSGFYTLAKNSTVTVNVYADIPSVSVPNGSDSFVVQIDVAGTSASSSSSISSWATGQTISVGNASLAVAQDPSTPVAALTSGNQTPTVAAFKFTSSNDQYVISDITLSVATNTTVSSLSLWDGATQVGTALPLSNSSSTFSGLNWVIPANSTKILTIKAALSPVGSGAGASGEQVQVTLHSYKNAPSSTGTYTTTTSGAVTGNVMYVYKTVPTITNVALPTSVLSAGTNTLAKFTINSGGSGTIGWAKLGFTITTSTNVTVTGIQVWDSDSNTQITGTASTTYTSTGLVSEFLPLAEQQVSGAKNYIVKATVGGTLASGAYVSTSIANPSTTFGQPVTAATATTTTASFVWSDVSAQNHSLTTSDWNKDFLVKSLPTDSQTLTK